MSQVLSPVTQSILLLTSPLMTGRVSKSAEPLTLGEYKKLALLLHQLGKDPAAFLGQGSGELIGACASIAAADRFAALFARGFALSQALEDWQARSIAVVSRADAAYPRSIKARLKGDAPPVLYFCGDLALADSGGLAVVGSRDVSDELLGYATRVGGLAASSGTTIVSGGARGIDKAGMGGALARGGKVVGILVDHLRDAVIERENRDAIMQGRLLLFSPYDPVIGFTVGNAMARNKLVYACAKAGLVVSSDHKKGGTWAGAIEQLEKFRQVPLYVRDEGEGSPGIVALRQHGALAWPAPATVEAFAELARGWQSSVGMASQDERAPAHATPELFGTEVRETGSQTLYVALPPDTTVSTDDEMSFEDDDHDRTERLKRFLGKPRYLAEIVAEFGIKKAETQEFLDRLTQTGALEKSKRPLRYWVKPRELFDDVDF